MSRTAEGEEVAELARQLAETTEVVDEIIGITAVDPPRTVYLSPAFEAITGRSRAEAMADPGCFFRLAHPDDARVLYEAYAAPDVPREYEYRIVRPDGELRWLLARAFPVRDDDGRTVRVVTLTRDVTARKRAELHAEAQHALLEGVLSALTTLLAADRPSESIDATLRVLGQAAAVDRVYIARHERDDTGTLRVALTHEWVQSGTASLLGDPEMSGPTVASPAARPLLERLERGFTAELRSSDMPPALLDRVVGSGMRSMLVVPITADGRCWGQIGFVSCQSERAWEPSVRSILEATAVAVGSAITRESAMDAVAEQVHRMRSLYESAANPALSPQDQIQRLLALGARLLEVDHVAVVRVRPEDTDTCELAYVHPADGARRPGDRAPLTPALWNLSVAEDRPVHIADAVGTPLEHAAAHRERGLRSFLGAPLWVRGQPWGGLGFLCDQPRARPFRETDSDLARLLSRGVAHLIEQIEAERERRALEASLREAQKLDSLGLLAGGIAHDFNNLLMGIMGNATVAARAVGRNETLARECIDQITATARRAADLTRQLLTYAGQGQVRMEPTSLSSVVREMSELLAVVLPKDARLVHDLDPELPPVQGDAAQLQQVVMNLITNARDALLGQPGSIVIRARSIDLPEGPPPARFVADDAPKGRYVVLEVSDSGVGLDEPTLERMFEPFFTTKRTGRGLGLAALLGVVRAHRGALEVESVPGAGATFRVFLPAAEGAPRERAEHDASDAERLDARVLVVDDTEHVLSTVCRVLESHGAEVVRAHDGLEAVDEVVRHGPRLDAVVLDLTMPRMNGALAHERIREVAPELPIVVMSGYTNDPGVREVLERPRTRFLQKPFTAAELVRALGRMLASAPR